MLISPLFNITESDSDLNNKTQFVFTLPIDVKTFQEVGKLSEACSSRELSCEWQHPETLEFQQSGCAVSRAMVDMGSGRVGTECTCTHLTVFAIAMRTQMRFAPLCQAQEVDYVLLALYISLAMWLVVQCARILYHKLYKSSIISFIQHSLLLFVCVLRVAYLLAKPVISSLAGLVLLGLLPSAVCLSLFVHLLLVWASLQLTTFQTSPFARFRKPFLLVTVLMFLLVLVLVVLLAALPDSSTPHTTSDDTSTPDSSDDTSTSSAAMQIVQGGSYLFAALTAIVCVLVLLSGLGLRRSLGSASSSPSVTVTSSSAASAREWSQLLRHRLLLATVGLSICLSIVACLWAAAVQTDILVSSAATLVTTTSFYVFDWLSLCVMAWVFSKAVREAVRRSKARKAKGQK